MRHEENIGDIQYLFELTASCPTTANVKYYAEMIRSKAMERRIKNTAQIIEGISRDDYEPDEEFSSNVEQLVTELRPMDNPKMLRFSETRDESITHTFTHPQVP
ncbi:DnaB-like helicase N-terminal domain-containing protein [Peribacillus sp. SI8-4]|uniref:DnaB-like helicase N-terminal domain-containing protein n=1 Tax=Peribacillus sp. SI8-4 TaxID=3048009 RepID=UPI0025560E4F|nr:DnaB-like helicase N-terminal domain-containing protein [Peribacillus sp. SI8-4]